MHPLIGLITLLTVLLLFVMMALVGRARARYGVNAPATTGPEGFERTFRTQMNTQESALMFLPALWTAAAFGLPWLAAIFGAVWLLARAWYAAAYINPARSRAIPFVIATLALLALVAQGLWGLGWTLALG